MVFDIDLREEQPGDVITIDEVLYANDGKDIKVGTPLIEGASAVREKQHLLFHYKSKVTLAKNRPLEKAAFVLSAGVTIAEMYIPTIFTALS